MDNIGNIDELREQTEQLKKDFLRSQKILDLIEQRRNEKLKKQEAFCVAIKGDNTRCRNYARKACPERLCHSHRALATDYVPHKKHIKKLTEGSEEKCWREHCGLKSEYVIFQGPSTKYCCWMHTT